MSIAIVDYGVGNLFSLSSSLNFLGLENIITRDASALEKADRVILPGVGAFGDAMDKLRATGLIPTLDSFAKSDRPLMGICLGMQLLFEESFEYGAHRGLGYIPGSVKPLAEAFEDKGISLKVPHMGWNSLDIRLPSCPALRRSAQGDFVYFVHSFYAVCEKEYIAASSNYGVDVPAVVCRDNVCGCQFHPEKSGAVGLEILRSFAEM